MLVLNANQEQIKVFNRLIQEMDVQVVWKGQFVIMGDRLILEGFIRSLIFHFDIQQTEVRLTEMLGDEGEELEISDYRGIEDLITMAVYAFEKWGTLKGVRVEQKIESLHQIFGDILRIYQIEVEFTKDRMQFLKAGMPVTYEDVVETVLAYEKEAKENLNIEAQEPVLHLSEILFEDTSSQGAARDQKAVEQRIEKYHLRIGVLDRLSELQRKTLARDIRNDKLLNDAEKQELYFPIEDYENQLAAMKEEEAAGTQGRNDEAAAERIEKYHARIGVLDRLSELQRKDLLRDIRNDSLLNDTEKQELYFPVEDYENQLAAAAAGGGKKIAEASATESQAKAGAAPALDTAARDNQAVQDRIAKYHARIGVLDRLSDLQKKTLVRDIKNDSLLLEKEKAMLIFPIQDYEYQLKMHGLDLAISDDANRSYAFIQKEIRKVQEEELFDKTKKDLLERLNDLLVQYGIEEVKNIMEQVPKHVERSEYQELMEKLAPYEGIDLGPYKEMLRKMRETLEIKEISNMLMQAEKNDRKGYMSLLRRIEEQGFARENAAPYIERILDWVSELDEERLKSMLTNVSSMDLETAASVYAMIEQESFLPKLRENALAVIARRLEEISMMECAMLVRVFQKTMESVIKKNPRHYFYPAEKIMKKTAMPEETRMIDSAAASYAQKRGRFEHPVFMVDVSKESNGRDGMLLTAEHLFYSTRMNGYRIPVTQIQSVRVTSGLLKNRALVAEERNGVKHKLPYAVGEEELQAWAELLGKFVRYLQKRRASGSLAGIAMQDSEAAVCSRCGCVLNDQQTCPECGKSYETMR